MLHTAHVNGDTKIQTAGIVDEVRLGARPQTWGDLAVFFRDLVNLRPADKVSAHPRALAPSAHGVRNVSERPHQPYQPRLPRQAVLGEPVLHARADRAFPAARRRGDLLDLQHQRRLGRRTPHRRRAAGALNYERRQRARQQPLNFRIVLRGALMEETALVEQAVARAQQLPSALVHRHNPPAPVELGDAQSGCVEQLRKRRAQGASPGQRLLDVHRLTVMGQQTPNSVFRLSIIAIGKTLDFLIHGFE